MSKVSERLAAEVEKSGMSAREIAAKAGVPKSAMQRYIAGTTERIPLSRLQSIADILHVSSAYLACWTDDPNFTVSDDQDVIENDNSDLSESEKTLLNLFRRVPEDQQDLVLQMIRAALNASK